MSNSPPTNPPPKKPRRQDFDSLGKSFLVHLPSLSSILEPGCTIVELLPTALRENTIERHVDFLAEVRLPLEAERWRFVAPSIRKFILHVEVTDRLNPELSGRLRSYRTRVTNGQKVRVLVVQHVLMISRVRTRSRQRRVFLYSDPTGQLHYVQVHYLDELHPDRLSTADRRTPWGKFHAMMYFGGQNPVLNLEAMTAVVHEKDPVQQRELLDAVKSARGILLELAQPISVAMKEASMQELTPAARRKFLNAGFEELLDTPENRDHMNQKYLKPVRKEGLEEGLEQGTRKAHVAALLHILRRNDIWLAKKHVRKLERMTCDELPALDVASDAADAKAFVRAANLDG